MKRQTSNQIEDLLRSAADNVWQAKRTLQQEEGTSEIVNVCLDVIESILAVRIKVVTLEEREENE